VHIHITKLSLRNRNLKNAASIPTQFIHDSVVAEWESRNKENMRGKTKVGTGKLINKGRKEEMHKVGHKEERGRE
jgi:hypothetical protein